VDPSFDRASRTPGEQASWWLVLEVFSWGWGCLVGAGHGSPKVRIAIMPLQIAVCVKQSLST